MNFLNKLTNRETEILRLIAQGKNNKDIAKLLCVSISTIQNHAHHVFLKLKVKNRTEASNMYWQSSIEANKNE